MNLSEALSRLLRAARWHRRSLGIVAAVVCLFATLSVLTPQEPESTMVLVATRDLPAGSQLTDADVELVPFPNELLPDGALGDTAESVGRTLTGALSTGSVLTTASILNGRDLGAATGERLVPFRVPDASTVQLLRVGDVISVVGSASDGSVIELASNVRVAALPAADSASGLGSSESGGLVVVAADEETAAALAVASTNMRMAIVLG